MTHRTVALETLGCKVNQYESSYFIETLKADGWSVVSFRDRADAYVVHGCAVTSRAGFQSRQLLRRALRRNPDASVVVAGCYAQLDAPNIAGEGLATHILGNQEKFQLAHWLRVPAQLHAPLCALSHPRHYGALPPLPVSCTQSARSRAFLKVQDGCDTFCSYCIVPFIRGRSRSLSAEDVQAQMKRYHSFGYGEVVLSGIHLGQWGRELDPPQDLVSLLDGLNRGGGLPPRVRLSSLEPVEWTAELLHRLADWPWICSHFHVPLQSGDEEILKAMHRPYTPEDYEAVIRELHRLYPEAALGADVMAGFPGETDAHFRRSCELIEQLPLTYLHVFPYSPRPGTAAAELKGRATGAELKRRTRVLAQLSSQKKEAFRNRFLGRTVEVVAETEFQPGVWQGTSDNYLQVGFPARSLEPGCIVKVKIEQVTNEGVRGCLLV